MIPKKDLPIVSLYGLAEIQHLALHRMLMERGIADPVKFLEENTVHYVPAFKASVGLTLVITEITPKANQRGARTEPPEPEGEQ